MSNRSRLSNVGKHVYLFLYKRSISGLSATLNQLRSQKLFTHEEAALFLQNAWGVKNVDTRIRNDRKNLVEEIILHVHDNVPFQGIEITATSSEKYKTIDVSTKGIKNAGVDGTGGGCLIRNGFLCALFNALGFSAQLTLSTFTSMTTYPHNHGVILLSDLEKDGDLHFIDCGTIFPFFRAVPLDFEQESPIYQDSFLEYKYIRHDGRILLMLGKGDLLPRNDPPVEGVDFILGRWRRILSFSPEPVNLGDFSDEHYFQAVDTSLLPRSPLAARYPGGRAVIINGNQLRIELQKGRLTKIAVLQSDDEIFKAYRRYFPTLMPDVVRRAIVEWRRVTVLGF